MKGLKKLNLGLVLAIIVIIGIVVYCIYVEGERKKAKTDINKTCEEFIQVTNAYAILPEEEQRLGIRKSEINLDNFSSKAESDLKGKMVSDESAEIQARFLTDVVEKQLLDTSKIITDYERKISKITSYQFDGNQVTVTFNSRVSIKKKYNDAVEEKISEDSFDVQGETITLEKKDGNWKVVYANLAYTNPESAITF